MSGNSKMNEEISNGAWKCPGHGCTDLSGCWRLKPCGCGGGDKEDERDEEDEAEKVEDMLYPVPVNSEPYPDIGFLYLDPPHVFGWDAIPWCMGDAVIIFLASLSNVDPPWKQWWVRVEENGNIDTCSGGREEGQQEDVCHGNGRGGEVCDLPKAL
ncbi:hypothetical protein V8G54_022802 [Vigna mungo]|uniref:Uncharacterized protein n=1 Tax=Vigna mungo TaxID=3915 RepID=A0AAQ3RRZ5_VIGMU